MTDLIEQTTLGSTGMKVFRLGLDASYRPGINATHTAIDEGVNFFFGFGIDTHLAL